MKKKILISIIIPVYNSANYLDKCIQSIINQEYKNIEVILVNDGSKDNSLNICYKYASNDKRIKVINQNNKGVSFARNAGLKIAKGDYITFCDSDDYVDKKIYTTMLEYIKQYNAEIAICNYYLVKNKVLIKPYSKKIQTILDRYSFLYYMSGKYYRGFVWNKMYKKGILKSTQFDENLNICEDTLFNVKISQHITKAVYIDEKLYNYVDRNDSISHAKYNNSTLLEMEAYSKIISYLNDTPEIIILNYKKAYLDTAFKIYLQYINSNNKDLNEKNKIKKHIDVYYNCIMKNKYINTNAKIYFWMNYYMPKFIIFIKKIYHQIRS